MKNIIKSKIFKLSVIVICILIITVLLVYFNNNKRIEKTQENLISKIN